MATLRDVLPREFFIEHTESPAAKYLDVEVVARYRAWGDGPDALLWPGRHQHVNVWWHLANGKAVGWNENPSRGWSFPVVRTNL